jgi:hypothetical protein
MGSEGCPSRSRMPECNIFIQLPGLRSPATIGTRAKPLQVWNLLITDVMLQDTVPWATKKQRNRILQGWECNWYACCWLHWTENIYRTVSLHCTFQVKSWSLFASSGTRRDMFCCIMNKNRFPILILMLQFDNADYVEERRSLFLQPKSLRFLRIL